MNTKENFLENEKFLEFLRTHKQYEDYYLPVKNKDPKIVKGVFLDSLWIIFSIFNIFGGRNMATISIISPLNSHPVKAGATGTIIVGLSQTDIYTLIHDCKVIVRDDQGREVFRGTARFHDGNANIETKWPDKPGGYSVQATANNLFGSVIALINSEITVEEDEKPKDIFNSM